MHMGSAPAVVEADRSVPIAGLKAQPGDVAAEMAAELLIAVREAR